MDPMRRANPRHVVEHHRDDQIALMQHLVVLEVVQQGVRNGTGVRHQVGRQTGRARCYAAMSRNASSLAEYFSLPDNAVVEIGTRVQI